MIVVYEGFAVGSARSVANEGILQFDGRYCFCWFCVATATIIRAYLNITSFTFFVHSWNLYFFFRCEHCVYCCYSWSPATLVNFPSIDNIYEI